MNLNPRFRQFYQDWKQKADEYSEEELRDVFDKFITLFVLYNFEYNEIVQILKSEGTHIYNQFDDRKAATDWVLQFIGSGTLISKINQSGLNDEVNQIIDLIENESFYIKLS